MLHCQKNIKATKERDWETTAEKNREREIQFIAVPQPHDKVPKDWIHERDKYLTNILI